MKKTISIPLISVLALFGLYHSVYFEKLDVKKQKESVKNFNPREKAEYFWNNELDKVLASAIELETFDSQLAENPEALMQDHGKSVGITSTYCFLVRGVAKQVQPGAEEIPVDLTDGRAEYSLKTKYIFGNTFRDATGYFNIDDFENTMDFNALSTELNKLILTRVITKLDAISPGEAIEFYGALEINSENLPQKIDIIPLKIETANE